MDKINFFSICKTEKVILGRGSKKKGGGGERNEEGIEDILERHSSYVYWHKKKRYQ